MNFAVCLGGLDGAGSRGASPLSFASHRSGISTLSGPLTLDGDAWITADARLDAREDLRSGLRARDACCLSAASDAQLLLRAYLAWGGECVQHLVGDFAFAIWDRKTHRLFCARDHFGVKPFFYAHKGDTFVFGSSLETVLGHPAVSRRMNDAAMADFLLFDLNQDSTTTAFADVRRLPPAHTLVLDSNGTVTTRRYWQVPSPDVLRFRRPSDYVDRFNDLFNVAVKDRLRTNRVAVTMSGGLDSTSVAAVARRHGAEVEAHTLVSDSLIPDQERHFSALAGRGMGVPVNYLSADGYHLFDGADAVARPEPDNDPLAAMLSDFQKQTATRCSVVLTGEGGDPAFLQSRGYLKTMVASGQWLKVGWHATQLTAWHRRLPRIGIRSALNGKTPAPWQPPYPAWLNPDFERALDLPGRWRDAWNPVPEVAVKGEVRPELRRALQDPTWAWRFEGMSPEWTGTNAEYRHPFFDVRLMTFMLAVPPLPWCAEKALLRRAMCGILPETIRLRPKTPLNGHPVLTRLARSNDWGSRLNPGDITQKYVRWNRSDVRFDSPDEAWTNLRPYSLALWMQHKLAV